MDVASLLRRSRRAGVPGLLAELVGDCAYLRALGRLNSRVIPIRPAFSWQLHSLKLVDEEVEGLLLSGQLRFQLLDLSEVDLWGVGNVRIQLLLDRR